MHLATVLRGAKDLKLEHVRTLPLQPNEISIAPRATGICGTDLHYYQNGKNGIYTIKNPLTLGHEASGEVIVVGAGVTNFQVGDRVVVEPQVSCLTCYPCRLGRYNLCPRMRFNGSASADPPAQGSLQKVWNHPAALCYKLPANVSFVEGALVEPLSVALHSVRKANLSAGQTVLITGAGAVGFALCSRCSDLWCIVNHYCRHGCRTSRLRKATCLADNILQAPLSANEGESNADFTRHIAQDIKLKHGVEAHAALECTGAETCLNLCINSVASGSKAVMVGMGTPRQALDIGVALVREIEIVGVWRYTNTFQSAIDLVATGMVNVVEALEYALSRPTDLVKCVITAE